MVLYSITVGYTIIQGGPPLSVTITNSFSKRCYGQKTLNRRLDLICTTSPTVLEIIPLVILMQTAVFMTLFYF